MGYILPVQPFQLMNYANRVDNDPKYFTHINRVEKVKFNPDSTENFEDDSLHEQEKKEEHEIHQAKSQNAAPPYKGFIQPNPVNLSPEISAVVGKGLNLNTYV